MFKFKFNKIVILVSVLTIVLAIVVGRTDSISLEELKQKSLDRTFQNGINKVLTSNEYNEFLINQYIQTIKLDVVREYYINKEIKEPIISSANARVTRLVNQALTKVCNQDLIINIRVIYTDNEFAKAEQINGFMLPNITKAALEQLTDNELFALVGHELSHFLRQDHYYELHIQHSILLHLNRFYNNRYISNEIKEKIEKYVQAGIMIVSKENEYEADYYGAMLAEKVGYGYSSVESMLKKIGMQYNTLNNKPDMYATHPSTQQRLSRLNYRKPTSIDSSCVKYK